MPKEIFLKSSDNKKIAINHFSKDSRSEVIIICPGWYMTKDASVFKSLSLDLFEHKDIICMDFRGHGKSSGFFSFSAKEYLDLKAVVDYSNEHYSDITLMGFSMGAATSIIYTHKHQNINSLILVSGPADYDKIENQWYKKAAVLPTLKKFELSRSLSIRPGNLLAPKIKPIDVIENIPPIPKLFIAGEKDPTVYPWHTEEQYKKATGPKDFIVFEGGYHAEDLYLYSKDKFLTTIKQFITNH